MNKFFKKLNQKGFSHHFIIPVVAIVAVAGIGTYIIRRSHAEELTNSSQTGTPIGTAPEVLQSSGLNRPNANTAQNFAVTQEQVAEANSTATNDYNWWSLLSSGQVELHTASGHTPGVTYGQPPANSGYYVGFTSTKDHKGYYAVRFDGKVFAFGDAHNFGNAGNLATIYPQFVASTCNATCSNDTGGSKVHVIYAMATRPQNDGYWLLRSDGAVFAFGNAKPMGSPPVPTSMFPGFYNRIQATTSGNGYAVNNVNGGIFAYGDAPAGLSAYKYFGAHSGFNNWTYHNMAMDFFITPTNKGYVVLGRDGGVYGLGDGSKYYKGNAHGQFTFQYTRSDDGWWAPSAFTIAPTLTSHGYRILVPQNDNGSYTSYSFGTFGD